jgi:Spy/CpxP family protein refolding chaperone
MKNKTIAFITLPALLLICSFSISNANAETTNFVKTEESSISKQERRSEHSAKKSRKKFQKLYQKLNLTEQQQTQVKALFKEQKTARQTSGASRKSLSKSVRSLDLNAPDYAEKLAVVKQQAGRAARGKIDAMMAMQQSMQKILTAEQFQKLQTLKLDTHGKRDKHKN